MPMPVDGTLCLSETDHFLWCKYQGVGYPHGFMRDELVQIKDPRSGEWRKPVLLMRYLDSNDMRPLTCTPPATVSADAEGRTTVTHSPHAHIRLSAEPA